MPNSSHAQSLAYSLKILTAAQVCLLLSACVTLDTATPEVISGAQLADGQTRIVYANAGVLDVAIASYNPSSGTIGSCLNPKRKLRVATTDDGETTYFAIDVQPGAYVIVAYSPLYPDGYTLAFNTIHSVVVPNGAQAFVGTFSDFLLKPVPGSEATRTWPDPIVLDMTQARSDTGSDALVLAPLTEIDPPKSICTGEFMSRADHIGD